MQRKVTLQPSRSCHARRCAARVWDLDGKAFFVPKIHKPSKTLGLKRQQRINAVHALYVCSPIIAPGAPHAARGRSCLYFSQAEGLPMNADPFADADVTPWATKHGKGRVGVTPSTARGVLDAATELDPYHEDTVTPTEEELAGASPSESARSPHMPGAHVACRLPGTAVTSEAGLASLPGRRVRNRARDAALRVRSWNTHAGGPAVGDPLRRAAGRGASGAACAQEGACLLPFATAGAPHAPCHAQLARPMFFNADDSPSPRGAQRVLADAARGLRALPDRLVQGAGPADGCARIL